MTYTVGETADRLGIPFAMFLGEDEIAAGQATLKDLQSGEQVTASPAALCAKIKESLAARLRVPPIEER